MATPSFRDSMNNLSWSRRPADAQPGASQSSPSVFSKLQSINPFGKSGYIQLPTTQEGSAAPLPAPTRREEEEGWFTLSRWDRLLIFAGCNIGALVCFAICMCFILFPALMLKPRKFAILWSVGSTLFLASWAVLMGPVAYAKHLASGPRLPFTAAYFASIGLTLYFAVGLKSTLLTLFSSVFQLAALIWYLVSYFPMGSTGLRFAARAGGGRIAAWVND